MDLSPSYSLSGIVIDQAHMLARYGHKVVIYVNEQYNPKKDKAAGLITIIKKYPELIKVVKLTKFFHLVDYLEDSLTEEHRDGIKPGADLYIQSFSEENIELVFTHDFVFQGWCLPYFHILKETAKVLKELGRQIKYFHWIHSMPSNRKDWWTLEKLDLDHFLVFPNKTEQQTVAEAYQAPPARVKVIPHIKDIRTWYEFCEDSMDLLDEYPDIMDAEVVQVYPCSTDRLSAKQLDIVLRIFANMKKTGIPVFLIIANQWGTVTPKIKESLDKYVEASKNAGLIYGKDYIFTSRFKKKFELGIHKRMLRELQLIQNLFIFPTREESFGLVAPEATLGGCLTITNKSLNMMKEVMSEHCPSFNFGSFNQTQDNGNSDDYIYNVSMAILGRLYANDAILSKIYCRLRYNMDSLYRKYYLPNFY